MESEFKYVLQVCYKFETKLIYVNDNSVETFLNECGKAFKIQCDKANVELTTQKNAIIAKHRFPFVIDKLSSCDSFCVNLKIDSLDNVPLVTTQNIEEFLIGACATHLLEQKQNRLTEKHRRQLVRHLCEFLHSKFEKPFGAAQKQATAKAAVALFPYLKSTGKNDGINILMDYINIKLRNDRHAEKRQHNGNLVEDNNNSTLDSDDNTDSQKNDVEFLKATTVNDTNWFVIQEKLKSSLSYRSKMLEKRELDLLETFPYFFTHPKLILYDFALRFADTNCNAFLDSWPENSVRLNDILKTQHQSNINTMWSRDIQDLLILLKILPAKANGRNLLPIASFNKATEKLFVFRERGAAINELLEKNNNFPYIIACGKTQKDITHYFIEVEKHILNVPEEFGAAETFDLFWKIHKVFNLDYDPNLKIMMKFVQQFIFRIDSKRFKTTMRMKDLQNSLSNSMKL